MKPSEAQIQEACCEFLALDGWRRIRTDLKHLRGMGVQEKGMADDLFIRYCFDSQSEIGRLLERQHWRSSAEVLWVEWKRERGGNGKKALYTTAEKARIHQLGWIEAERARGALVLLAGVDFPATIDGFIEFYRKSGLARRLRQSERDHAVSGARQ